MSFSQTTIYTTNFNSADEGWTNTGANNWIRGDVDFTTGADGNYWGYNNVAGAYATGDQAIIQSPIIDLSLYNSMTFSIDVRYEADNQAFGFFLDGFIVQYSIDGGANWINLGTIGEGTNWYNQNVVTIGDAWSLDNGAWETTSRSLPTELVNNCEAAFRVLLNSFNFGTADEGVAFDNVIITGTETSIATPTV